MFQSSRLADGAVEEHPVARVGLVASQVSGATTGSPLTVNQSNCADLAAVPL